MKLPYKSWHLLAIGGVGMSALAKVLKHFGAKVSGSDLHDSLELRRLKNSGIHVSVGHHDHVPEGTEALVYSSAIKATNPKVWEARARGIPVYHRAEILADLLNHTTSIGVTGTHGKTTTSACASYVLHALGKNPTCLVGGDIRNVGNNVILGDRKLIVSEVDESDQTQELMRPTVAVITNLEADHLDQYGSYQGIEDSFRRYFSRLKDRSVVVSGDDANLVRLACQAKLAKLLTCGFDSSFDCFADEIELEGFGSRFNVTLRGKKYGAAKLSVPGIHNISNALAVITACSEIGVMPNEVIPTLEQFRGAGRRLEVLVDREDVMVIDDYAHHPTEVAASVRSLKTLKRPLTVVYQPHRFSRTLLMGDTFGRCFDEADRVIITDIYAADEIASGPVSAERILSCVRAGVHREATYIPRSEILPYLDEKKIPREIVAFLGAGDIGEIAHAFTERRSQVSI